MNPKTLQKAFLFNAGLALIFFVITGILVMSKVSKGVIGFFGFLSFIFFSMAFILGCLLLFKWCTQRSKNQTTTIVRVTQPAQIHYVQPQPAFVTYQLPPNYAQATAPRPSGPIQQAAAQPFIPQQVQLISPISATPPPSGNGEHTCKVCYEAPVNSVLIPCGHAGLCVSCACTQKASGKGCPFCRAPINEIVKQYFV
mmetsp:Transcript_27815/g.39194  ORF Transcript_27815/g.39194 Transcript_27815/m.39194 type:complete len:198 (+) Transcript_27815:71-664(+)